MKSKAVSEITLTLLFIGMLTLAFNLQPAKAEPKTWTVDDDGPADFSSIQEAVNVASPGDTIYVYNGTYYEHVVVNKSVSLVGEEIAKPIINATGTPTSLNGTYSTVRICANNVTINGFEIQNPTNDYGIFLNHSSNSIVNENVVKGTIYAIIVEGGSGNTISDNKVEGLEPHNPCVIEGIRLTNSSNNIVTGNYLSFDCHNTFTMHNSNNNYVAFNYMTNHFSPFPFGIWNSNNNLIVGNTIWKPVLFGGHIYLVESNDNVLYHNSFLVVDGGSIVMSIDDASMNNTWDNGYPSGGNYWSDYTGVDTNMDGIGDSSYEVNANNTDHYPLMSNFSDFSVTYLEEIYHVTTVCNSIISAFEFDQVNKIIRFNVTGEEGIGFCRVCIPHDLMEPYTVTVDGHSPQYVNYTLYDNGTHRWIYFTYQHSTHEVMITQAPVGGIYIPADKLELLAPYIALTILLAIAVIAVGYVKKRKRNTEVSS